MFKCFNTIAMVKKLEFNTDKIVFILAIISMIWIIIYKIIFTEINEIFPYAVVFN